MAASPSTIRGVVIADVVGSSQISDLRQVRDEALARLSKLHLEQERVLARYTVTAWDEFQNILALPSDLPRVVWDLRLAFAPAELRIGIGLGTIQELPGPDTPINEVSMGEAFLRAREAATVIGKEGGKFRRRTLVRSGELEFDRTLNLIYLLIDSLLSGLSDRQWETSRAYMETGSLSESADLLGLRSESTVSRNLHRGFFWQLVEANQELSEVIRTGLARESAKD